MMMIENPHLLPKVRSAKLLAAVKDMPCTLRVSSFMPHWQCAHQSTVVPCHLDRTIGKGMSTKVSDLFVAAGCVHCHAIIDGKDRTAVDYIMEKYPAAMMQRMLAGMAETQARWVVMGLLTGDDWEIVR
jgi:hypothetical protein